MHGGKGEAQAPLLQGYGQPYPAQGYPPQPYLGQVPAGAWAWEALHTQVVLPPLPSPR